mgnify:CR=1 FL=1
MILFGLERDLYKTTNRIRRDGYSDICVEPHVSYSSVPDVHREMGIRVHNLWYPDSRVLVVADEEILLERKVTNPRWVRKVFREYPPVVLLGSLFIAPISIPLILQERYNFENHDERVEATIKPAQEVREGLEKYGVHAELSDLVGEVKATVGKGYFDVFPENPKIRGL